MTVAVYGIMPSGFSRADAGLNISKKLLVSIPDNASLLFKYF